MVVTKLQGGLGNQLFQYVAGLVVARRLGTDVVVEPTYYNVVQNRHYVLDKLGFFPDVRTYPFLFPLNFTQTQRQWFSLVSNKHLYGFDYIREENQFTVDQALYKASDNVFLLGFWQHKQYVEEVADLLRESFSRHVHFSGKVELISQMIHKNKSVGMHIRRTDYVTSSSFEPCPPSYYHQAISDIKRQVSHPRFFIFSDDVDWVKHNISLPEDTVYVSDYGFDDWQEFILLSLCKHIVIANSTFSWWAAWFHDTKNRVVIMPKYWSSSSPKAISALSYSHWDKI